MNPAAAALISRPNLRLAWERMSTGRNHQHKRYFRHLYAAYTSAVDENLADLNKRLRHGSYKPEKPTRIFLPKPSGLQRPLTLLSIEDQVVLQAIANLFARRLGPRRRELELKTVYSNVLDPNQESIFFVKDWHLTYNAFTKKIGLLYRQGFHWIAAFDLAAYYDTISHDLLLRTAFPRGGLRELSEVVLSWFRVWSSETAATSHAHGIPQGPIASDFLAECFLLPVDESLATEHVYIRYVDDIRLFGRSESEVQRAAIELEVQCRNRGLIPQAKKFAITKAKSLDEALSVIPSMGFAGEAPEEGPKTISAPVALRQFRKSLAGRPKRIADKTRARFVLYRAVPSGRLLRYVRALLPHHPEHIDAFVFYISQWKRDVQTISVCRQLLKDSPYEYVRGEAWQILARMMVPDEMVPLLDSAIGIARRRSSSFSLKWGACTYLCAAEHRALGNYSRWIKYLDNPLLQALLAPILPRARFNNGDVVTQMLRRSAIEPGLGLTTRLVQERISLANLGVRGSALPIQVQRVYKAIGIIRGRIRGPEPVAELLERSLSVPAWAGWRNLLGPEYAHACQLLAQAVPVFNTGRSIWLIHQNSFNHAVFLAFQRCLHERYLPGQVNLTNRNGEMISFGNMLQKGNPFSRTYPPIADAFRGINARRNTVPQAHPYATKGGGRTIPLKAGEQKALARKLRLSFIELAKVIG